MPKHYPQSAIEDCRKFYCEFGGNREEIEKAMRKAGYVGWRKQNLNDRNGNRMGWVSRFGFEKSLELHLRTRIGSVESDDERRYRAVVKLADRFQERALGDGEDAERAVDKFIKLTQQQIELRSKLDLSTANFETFVEDFELMVSWAKEIDTELAKLFYRHKDRFIGKAEIHFGANGND